MQIEMKDLTYRKIAKLLKTEKEIVCITPAAHGAVAVVGLALLLEGKPVNAKITASYAKTKRSK